IQNHTNNPSPGCLTFVRSDHAALILYVKSKKADTVVASIYRELRNSSKEQFTTTRPAALVVRLVDLSIEQLMDIARRQGKNWPQGNSLQQIANVLFRKRDFLRSIMFMSGEMEIFRQQSPILGAPTISRSSAPVYQFENSNCIYPGKLLFEP